MNSECSTLENIGVNVLAYGAMFVGVVVSKPIGVYDFIIEKENEIVGYIFDSTKDMSFLLIATSPIGDMLKMVVAFMIIGWISFIFADMFAYKVIDVFKKALSKDNLK